MRNILLLTGIALMLTNTASAQDAPYRLAPDPSAKFELLVRKTGLMSGKEHLFAFPRFQGELVYDAAAPERSKVTLRIDASAIQCHDTWVSDKDRQKILDEAKGNMLQVSQHPELRFVSQSIRKEPGGAFTAQGDLTIRGLARPVSVLVRMNPDAQGRLRFTGESTIDMTAWGLKPPRAALGAIGTDKLMTVRFELLAAR
jgi:polyisoprenoid-binding protein YceI